MNNSRNIFVFISLGSENHFVGRLWCHNRNGRDSASFEYDKAWLNYPERFALEPALTLAPGTFHTVTNQTLFGAIGDSAPDRWGRVLMRRTEIARAKKAGEVPHTLREVDFLLGVNDEAREGALRFTETINGAFLAPKGKKTIPPLVDLPRLLSATERFLDEEESLEDLRLLLAPGSSLGGARPKASIIDSKGNLSIAKFPHKDDDINVVEWEAVALELAKKSGLVVPAWQINKIIERSVLIIRRFDRVKNIRIPFLSAMSMLGARDNEAHSYLEIADVITQHGASPNEDMVELWSRIVFNILISNTDDHLRNHGFLYEHGKGWRLSPVYDINPTPLDIRPRILTTMIDLYDSTASIDLAMSVAADFRISNKQAKLIVNKMARTISEWQNVAQSFHIPKREIDRMASSFEHADLKKALTY